MAKFQNNKVTISKVTKSQFMIVNYFDRGRAVLASCLKIKGYVHIVLKHLNKTTSKYKIHGLCIRS